MKAIIFILHFFDFMCYTLTKVGDYMNFITLFFLTLHILPCIYFLYTYHQKNYQNIIIILTIISFLSFLFKIDILIYFSYFYMINNIILTFFFIIYHLFQKVFKKENNHCISLILLICSLIITSFGIYHHHDKKIQNYDITIYKETSLEQLNIGMISDIHLGSGTDLKDIKKMVEIMNTKDLSLMVLCGDLFDESSSPKMIEQCLRLIDQIQTTYGIFAINGNHEVYANLLNNDYYKNTNIQYLRNEYVCIDGLMNIVGLEDKQSSFQKDLSLICKDMDLSLPTIVLDHNPSRFQDIKYIADLQLSGHTHNGQIFPGSLIVSSLFENAYGLLTSQEKSLIVSSGFGSWGFPFRLGSDCEIVLIHVSFFKKTFLR